MSPEPESTLLAGYQYPNGAVEDSVDPAGTAPATSSIPSSRAKGKRRGKSEGSIYQRANGKWFCSVENGWQNGKRKRRVVSGKTRAEVARKLRELQTSVDSGTAIPDQRMNLGAYLGWWLSDVAKPRIRYSTYVSYESKIRMHVLPTLERVPLAKLTPAHLQRLMNMKRSEGLSGRSVQYIHAILRTALNDAVKMRMASTNVATMVNPPKSVRGEITPYSPQEIESLLTVVLGHRLGALYTVAIALGLRQGEALGLRWADVDLEDKILRVRHTLQRQQGLLRLVEPKTKRSRRTVPLPDVCVRALRDHRRMQAEERLAAGPEWHDNNFVFTTAFGNALDARNVVRHFHAQCKKAGIPQRRFHDLRHTAATLLLAQGVAARVVMETLGHSSFQLTMDTYTHVMPVLQRQAAEAMDRALPG